jgi:hypothetical protein
VNPIRTYRQTGVYAGRILKGDATIVADVRRFYHQINPD